MISTAIIGTAGFSGQETLDRVLAHPELELARARLRLPRRVSRRARSTCGSAGTGTERSRVRAQRGGARRGSRARLLLSRPRGGRRARAAGRCGRRRPLRRAPARRPGAYAEWYGFVHPGGNEAWCYALPELAPPTGRLIANPGCYATAALLALAPLADAIEPAGVVVDAKSGVSGAGRALKESSHAATVLDNVSPYRVGAHQHEPEIEQAARLSGLLRARTCYRSGAG